MYTSQEIKYRDHNYYLQESCKKYILFMKVLFLLEYFVCLIQTDKNIFYQLVWEEFTFTLKKRHTKIIH